MTLSHEEALRALRIADRDVTAFNKMKEDPDFHSIHDLARLALTLQEHDIAVPCAVDELRKLNPFAVTFRYDDTDIPLITSDEVARMVNAMRSWAGEVVK